MAGAKNLTTPDRVLVTGGLGQLGHALAALLGDDALALDREDLDITSHRSIEGVFAAARPRAVINCAAFTNVDAAEQEPQAAQHLNADGVALLARACAARDIPLVQISTDYVFGGDSQRSTPLGEHDEPAPINAYGRSKWDGEQAAARCSKHFIVRTCGLYGVSSHGRNFVETMLRLAASGRTLSVVDDQHCTPTSAADLAQAVAFLLTTSAYGTYHVVNHGATTWHGFATEILRLAQLAAPLRLISSEEYGGTPRPKYSVLDTTKYQKLGAPPLRPWQAALAEYLQQRKK